MPKEELDLKELDLKELDLMQSTSHRADPDDLEHCSLHVRKVLRVFFQWEYTPKSNQGSLFSRN